MTPNTAKQLAEWLNRQLADMEEDETDDVHVQAEGGEEQ